MSSFFLIIPISNIQCRYIVKIAKFIGLYLTHNQYYFNIGFYNSFYLQIIHICVFNRLITYFIV
jgi:hypothetical protein